MCPHALVGYLIGKKGAMIKRIKVCMVWVGGCESARTLLSRAAVDSRCLTGLLFSVGDLLGLRVSSLWRSGEVGQLVNYDVHTP